MKPLLKLLATLALTLVLSRCSDTKNSAYSTVSFPQTLDLRQQKNLFILCRLWGFFKYYHPNVTDGSHRWDDELAKKTPLFLGCQSENDLDRQLNDWLDELGTVDTAGEDPIPDTATVIQKHDWTWLTQLDVPQNTVKRLLRVKNSVPPKSSFFVTKQAAGNPAFIHEDSYTTSSFPNQNLQFLSLCRYWNYIEYFFPYKSLMDKPMESLFLNHVRPVTLARTRQDYHLSMLTVCTQINDGHALIVRDQFIESYKGYLSSCAKLEYIQDNFVVTNFFNDSLAAIDKLKIGDKLVKIKGKAISELIHEKATITPGSNQHYTLKNIGFDLLRDSTKTLAITINRNGKTIQQDIRLYEARLWQKIDLFASSFPRRESYQLVAPTIGYLNLARIKKSEVREAFKLFENTTGLIIDNRGYPLDFPLFDIADRLVDQETGFAKITSTDMMKPGDFVVSYTAKLKGGKPPVYPNKLVILIDANTISSSEYHTMAFKKVKGARTLGTITAGADGNITEVILPDGIQTRFTGLGVLHEDLSPTQRRGIVPDITVHRTYKGVMNRTDEQLEHAIRILSK